MKKQGFGTKQRYVKELTPIEHAILGSNIAISIALFICDLIATKDGYKQGTIYLSVIAAIVSIFSVMAGVKKKPLCPLLGIIGSFLLMPIAGHDGLMATMIMFGINAIVQTVSLITGIKNSDNKSSNVKVVEIKNGQFAIYLTVIVGLIVLYTGVEGLPAYVKAMSFGQQTTPQPLQVRIFDSATLMFALGCCIPMMFRGKIVGIMYIFNDASQLGTGICMICLNVKEMHNGVMLVSVLGLLLTSILGLVRGYKNNKK